MSRYLKRQHNLTREALDRLLAGEPAMEQSAARTEHKPSLYDARLQTVLATIKSKGTKRVLDLGCGEGKLLRSLLADSKFETLTSAGKPGTATLRKRRRPAIVGEQRVRARCQSLERFVCKEPLR